MRTPKGLFHVARLLLLLAAALVPSSSRADQGGVELVNGGRINGDVMVIMPGDHVAIRLADGTAISVAWADIARVFDGPRLYDGNGLVSAAPTAPAAPTPIPAPAPSPLVTMVEDAEVPPIYQTARRRDDPAYRLAYRSLPRRVGTVVLFSLGATFVLNGVGMITSGAMLGCLTTYGYGDSYYGGSDARCAFRTGMIAGGGVSLALGTLSLWRAIRRKNIRSRGVRQLEQGVAATADQGVDFTLDARIDGQTFVPSLTLRF